ncbi:MAG: metallophosphoesterase family protein [Pseudomonadota bacterium]
MKRLLSAALLGLAAAIGTASAIHPGSEEEHKQPPWQEASGWPDRVVVTLPKSPQTSFAITWRTDQSVTETVAQIVEARDDARFDLGAEEVAAKTERLALDERPGFESTMALSVNKGLPPAHFHSVVFEGLKPDTLYAYRVQGAEGLWSEWFQTRTAAESGPVTFLYIGDAQNALQSHWSRIIRAGFQEAPKADFILHAGDLVNRASRDFEWAEWFEATGFIHGMIPAVPLAGNHEYEYLRLPEGAEDGLLSIMWRPQFTLPEEPTLHADLQEVAYDMRYTDDVHFFVLSTQSQRIAEQAEWLDRELAASDAKWKIVTMHHPIFSSGADRDSPPRRAALLPVIQKHGVDLVLQGHDHTYARGAIGQTPERFVFGKKGGKVDTMFVNSVSGPKMYNFREGDWDDYASDEVVLIRKAENTQFFQVITIDDDKLTYEAHTATGALYDDFVMTKNKRGAKRITRGATSTMDERLFSNSGPYETP